MLRQLLTVSLLSMLSLLGFAQSPRGTLLLIPPQEGSPVQIIEATFGMVDLIESAKLENRQAKRITSYRLVWIEIASNGNRCIQAEAEKHLLASSEAEQIITLPAQGISAVNLKSTSKEIRFYIAELGFEDGSRWKADLKKLKALK